MVHISQKLAEAKKEGRTTFSFEYFPPKTAQGVQNLYDRLDRMHDFGPSFIDITWGAGGRNSDLTTEITNVALNVYGLETCMHLTCTEMPKAKIDKGLEDAYKAGCTNILALRGDPPQESDEWIAIEGGFRYAKDLVRYIREKYGDYFDIGVAGYSERSDDNENNEELVDHLKEKVDAGATFVITQMMYDVDNYLDWVARVRAKGITVPIIPGIMPIHTYAAFIRRATWTKAIIPPSWTEALDPIKNDDQQVREVGKVLVAEICRKLMAAGLHHLHFYTMNLAIATKNTLEELGLLPNMEAPLEKPLPWRQSLGLNRKEENVRPIFWRNRNRSYIARTQDWDEFPNGRWGDSRSPAFGELDGYGIGLKGTSENNLKLWGKPSTLRDVANLFVRYMQGDLPSLPWSEMPLSGEADSLVDNLVDLNQRGIHTINSQPAINGMKSSHPVYGWGPKNGYVFQKGYLEVLIHPELIAEVITRIERNPEMTYYAVNTHGDLKTNSPDDSPNAVTWGVFPGKEIVQPTIVEAVSFLAWKEEFYRLGHYWAGIYPPSSPSRYLIKDMMDTYYLVNIVHNDFHEEHGIFPLFDGLQVRDLDSQKFHNVEPISEETEPPTTKVSISNGESGPKEAATNGVNGVKH